MKRLLAVFLLAGAANASAKDHRVEVRISDGTGVYAKVMNVRTGGQAHFTGLISPGGGAPGMLLAAEMLLSGGKEPTLMYQVNISGGKDSTGPFIKGQGEVAIRPGEGLTAIECGAWAVELSLDPPGAPAARGKAERRPGAGAGNYSLSTEISRDGLLQKTCRQTGAVATQNDAFEGSGEGGNTRGLMVNGLVSRSRDKEGEFDLLYQVDYTPASGPEKLQLQGDVRLVRGQKAAVKSGSYLIEFRLGDRQKRAAAGKAKKGGSPSLLLAR